MSMINNFFSFFQCLFSKKIRLGKNCIYVDKVKIFLGIVSEINSNFFQSNFLMFNSLSNSAFFNFFIIILKK